jgi:hypothetical protein
MLGQISGVGTLQRLARKKVRYSVGQIRYTSQLKEDEQEKAGQSHMIESPHMTERLWDGTEI